MNKESKKGTPAAAKLFAACAAGMEPREASCCRSSALVLGLVTCTES